MKLKAIWIQVSELQEYLDKYQDKIKFIFPCTYLSSASTLTVVIDES